MRQWARLNRNSRMFHVGSQSSAWAWPYRVMAGTEVTFDSGLQPDTGRSVQWRPQYMYIQPLFSMPEVHEMHQVMCDYPLATLVAHSEG